jgi:hypothetical protein
VIKEEGSEFCNLIPVMLSNEGWGRGSWRLGAGSSAPLQGAFSSQGTRKVLLVVSHSVTSALVSVSVCIMAVISNQRLNFLIKKTTLIVRFRLHWKILEITQLFGIEVNLINRL